MLYFVTHHHRHGSDFFLVEADEHPSDEAVEILLTREGVDLELDKEGEWLDISPASAILTITPEIRAEAKAIREETGDGVSLPPTDV